MGPNSQIGLARVTHMAWPKTHTPVWRTRLVGLAHVAHTTTPTPPDGRVLHTAAPSLDTRPCLPHSQPHSQAHARVASTESFFSFCQNPIF
ncbi:hypothetical protein PVK06_012936 [Gossypium arboreum]|uniref:Uncharacterized protein n=1 Tax=Gossypium arboreum TaxID=29729 RepID=A0ABR0QDJ9_GOSAR|nr:hypothetical protein PVK06_012936 [Gossypium arboreum]